MCAGSLQTLGTLRTSQGGRFLPSFQYLLLFVSVSGPTYIRKVTPMLSLCFGDAGLLLRWIITQIALSHT